MQPQVPENSGDRKCMMRQTNHSTHTHSDLETLSFAATCAGSWIQSEVERGWLSEEGGHG